MSNEIEEDLKFKSILLDNAAESFIVHDLQGKMIYVNRASYEARGYTREEMMALPLTELATPENAGLLQARVENVIKNGSATFESSHFRKDASIMDVEVYARLIEFEGKKIIASTIRDITQRKQFEELLRESEDRYRTLVESSDDNIATLDRELRYEYVNEKAASRFGTKPEDIIGKHLSEVFPENYKQLKSTYESVLESGKISSIITLVKFPVGELWMDLKLIPIRVENGKANALMVVARDITKAKNEEIELEKSYQTQNVLNSLLALSLEDISLDKQLERTVDIILAAPLMQVMPKGGIFLVEDDPDKLVLKASRNLPPSLQKLCGKVPFGECLCGRAAASGRMIFSAEVDHRHDHRYEGMVPHGHYNVPILSRAKKGKVLGVVVLYLQEGHRYEKREEEFLQSVANTLAIMIERKQAEKAVIDSEERYRVLAESSLDSIFVIGADDRFRYVNSFAAKSLGHPKKEIIGEPANKFFPEDVYKATKLDRDMVIKSGKPASFENKFIFNNQETWLLTQIVPIKEGDKITATLGVARDITERKRFEAVLRESEERYRQLIEVSPVGIVIHSEGKIVFVNPATVALLGGKKPEEFTGKTVVSFVHPDFRKTVADRIGRMVKGDSVPVLEEKFVGLDGKAVNVEVRAVPMVYKERPSVEVIFQDITQRKKQEEKLKTAKELSDALNTINTAITSTFDFEKIMKLVTEEATVAMGCESGRILLRDGQEWLVKYAYGFAPEPPGLRLNDDEAKTTVLAARTGTVVAVNDAYNDDRVNPEIMRKFSTRSILVVPLITKDKVIGAMLFQYHSAPVGFNEAQIDFAEKLAASVALSMENARLYEAERNIADTLQEELLSVPDEIEGVNFGYLYRSATKAARVGGDFYDIFELQGGRIGILVGDVSGKGIEAAVVTSTAKSTLKAFSFEETSPAEIIAKTNDLVMKVIGEGLFITLFFGILDKNTGKLTYRSAGHPEAIIKKGRKTSFLVTGSPAMVPMAGLKFIDNEDNLRAGDILVLYTDGVTEARNADREFFGHKRLLKFVRDLNVKSVRQLPNLIHGELTDFTGGTLNDDIAILTVSLEDQ